MVSGIVFHCLRYRGKILLLLIFLSLSLSLYVSDMKLWVAASIFSFVHIIIVWTSLDFGMYIWKKQKLSLGLVPNKFEKPWIKFIVFASLSRCRETLSIIIFLSLILFFSLLGGLKDYIFPSCVSILPLCSVRFSLVQFQPFPFSVLGDGCHLIDPRS